MAELYLDHNASNLIDPRLLEVFVETLRGHSANPGSPHGPGRRARARIEKAREAAAEAFGYPLGQTLFCSSGTEALNFAIKGLSWRPGERLIIAAVEHKAALEAAASLEGRGVLVDIAAVDGQGRVDPAALSGLVRAETRLCIVMAANNEVGTLQPLSEVKAALPSRVPLLVDGVQAAGRGCLDSEAADILVISGHKMRAPKGAAALLWRPALDFAPLLHGGSQERGLRAGTEDTAAIAALGEAARLAKAGELMDCDALRARRDAFEEQLRAIPGLAIQGEKAPRLPQTTNATLAGWTNESLITLLDLEGIAVSSGSACTSGSLLPSHVLAAMGLSEKEARSALRFSFGPETGSEDLVRAAETLAKIVG